MKKLTALLLALFLSVPGLSLAESFSFPEAGVFVETQPDWTLLCPETLASQAELLSRLGADEATLHADWAAAGTVFEVFLPQSMQVRLNCVETEQASILSDAAWMTEDAREAFRAEYDHAPFENVRYCEEAPDWLQLEWTLMAGEMPVRFCWLITIRQGALYTLTASGADADMDALCAANLAVLDSLSFLGTRLSLADEANDGSAMTLPQPVMDDGVVTPLSLPGFTGLSTDNTFALRVETLPGTELVLQTPTDSLRGVAGKDGSHTFSLSTKQTKVYAYTLTAQAEGRKASAMEIEILRELTGEARMEAYRDSARAVDGAFYEKLSETPAEYKNTAVSFRGKVFEIADLNGLPCALVYSANPGTGVWRNPVRVLLNAAMQLEEGRVYSFYGDVRGDSLPGDDEQALAPVVICRSVN